MKEKNYFGDDEALKFYREQLKESYEEIDKRNSERTGPYIYWMKEKEDDSIPMGDDDPDRVPTISRQLYDYESGFAFLGGQANHGKSSFIVSLMNGLLDCQDDTIIIDVSLDDPKSKRFVQMISCLSGLPYYKVIASQNLTEPETEVRNAALSKYFSMIEEGKYYPFNAYDKLKHGSGDNDYHEIHAFRKDDFVYKILMPLREANPGKKIICFLDAFSDLDLQNEDGKIDSFDKMMRSIKNAANDLRIPIFTSGHLRKGDTKNSRGLFSMQDFKGSAEIAYSAVWAGGIHNDYRHTEGMTPLKVRLPSGGTMPVLTIQTVKSKVSMEDQRLFYGLKHGVCKIYPLDRVQFKEASDKFFEMHKQKGKND